MKYQEKAEIKNALVKVNLCEDCGVKINYKVTYIILIVSSKNAKRSMTT